MKFSEDFGKIKNEDLRGLKIRYRGRNNVHRSQDILYESKHPKGRRNIHLCTGTHSRVPRAWAMLHED